MAFAVVAASVLAFSAAAGGTGYGVATVVAFGAGVAVCEGTAVSGWFRDRSGLVMAVLAGLLTGIVLVVLAAVGAPMAPEVAFLLVLVPAFVVGLDWRRVDRLRPVLVLATLPVLVAAWIEPGWMWLALAAWGAALFAAFAVLEADRRAGLPQVQPTTPGGDPARVGDLTLTLVISLVAALVAVLLLSVPSCQRDVPEAGSFDGSGSLEGSGSLGGGGVYVPDANGRYLVPSDGSGDGSGGVPDEPIPLPDGLARPGPGEQAVQIGPSGERLTVEGLADGDRLVTIEDPDGRTWRYRIDEDGPFARITRLDEQGRPERSWLYDPNGTVAVDGATPDGTGSNPPPDDPPAPPSRAIDWRVVGAVVVALVALAALVWWLVRRRPPTAPTDLPATWALDLLRRLDALGAARVRPRGSDEPIATYTSVLAGSGAVGPEVVDVGEVLCEAFYGRLADEQRRPWAERTMGDLEGMTPVAAEGTTAH